MGQKVEHDHVLELRQTIQIMQEQLDEREGEPTKLENLTLDIWSSCCSNIFSFLFFHTEAELSRRKSEDNQENLSLSKKAVVVLKEELAQKTEELNKALKRENELKVSECN